MCLYQQPCSNEACGRDPTLCFTTFIWRMLYSAISPVQFFKEYISFLLCDCNMILYQHRATALQSFITDCIYIYFVFIFLVRCKHKLWKYCPLENPFTLLPTFTRTLWYNNIFHGTRFAIKCNLPQLVEVLWLFFLSGLCFRSFSQSLLDFCSSFFHWICPLACFTISSEECCEMFWTANPPIISLDFLDVTQTLHRQI